jgi:hypothetical protein
MQLAQDKVKFLSVCGNENTSSGFDKKYGTCCARLEIFMAMEFILWSFEL